MSDVKPWPGCPHYINAETGVCNLLTKLGMSIEGQACRGCGISMAHWAEMGRQCQYCPGLGLLASHCPGGPRASVTAGEVAYGHIDSGVV